MRAIVKPWDEIRKTLEMSYFHREEPLYFTDGMRKFCSTVINVEPSPFRFGQINEIYNDWQSGWNWHPSWIDIINENEWDAEIYALLLIESGVIYE